MDRIDSWSIKSGRRHALIACVLLASSLLTLSVGCRSQAETPAEPARPNIIFIMEDTLRADRLGAYGNPNGLTPMIDSLATEGVLFERVIAPGPWTLPSVGSLFTGFYPTVHKAMNARNDRGGGPHSPSTVTKLSPDFVTLAEKLQENGYATAAACGNWFIVPRHGFGQGFDSFDSRFTGNSVRGYQINRSAVNWLKARDPNKPFFLYLHYMDAHGPYYAEPKYMEPALSTLEQMPNKTRLGRGSVILPRIDKQYQRDPRHRQLAAYGEYWTLTYDMGVRQADEYLLELRNSLKELGVWDDALIIFVSDHGEGLGEHRFGGKPFWEHGYALTQTQVHVPLIFRWPGHLEPGRRIREVVGLIDLMPTLLEMLSIEPPPGIQAESFYGLLRGGEWRPRPLLSEKMKQMPQIKSLVSGPWKLMGDIEQNQWALYNYEQDPLERQNVSAQYAAKFHEMLEYLRDLDEMNVELAKNVDAQDTGLTPRDIQRLRSLGYIDGPTDTRGEPATQPQGTPPATTAPTEG